MPANPRRHRVLEFAAMPWRALRWALLARPIRFTRFGTFYILFSLAVGAAAINTGNNLLYLILGLLLGLIVVSGFLSDSGLWGLGIAFHLQGTAYAGEPAGFELELEKTWFPSVMTWITAFWNDGGETAALAPWVPAHGRARLLLTMTPRRRGRLQLTRMRYASRFPFGLFEKFHTEHRREEWIVYPARVPVDAAALQTMQAGDQTPNARRAGNGDLPYLLRDYREGDSLRRIQWKISAKRGQWTVQDMEAESVVSDWLTVPAWPANLTEAAREHFISFLASVVEALLQKGRRVGLATPDACFSPDLEPAQKHRLLRYLALVDFSAPVTLQRRWPPEAAKGLDAGSLWKQGGYVHPSGSARAGGYAAA
jgi:uncharacterized protein (DUF58 family)